jgi:translocation and assembly module TamB
VSEPPAPDTTVEASSVRRRRRLWLALPLAVLLQLLLLAVLVSAWALGTQSGLRALLALAGDIAPGLVTVERAEGRLLGDLRLTGVAVRTPDLSLDLGELRLSWAPLAALTGTLRVEELALRDLDLVTAPGEKEDTGPLELPSVFLPLGIELERVRVERVSIAETGGEPLRIDHLDLAASLRGADLVLHELAVGLPEPALAARAEGRAELSGDYPLTLALGWSLALPAGAELAGEAGLSGDLKRLELGHTLSGAVQARLDADLRDLLDHPRWDGTLVLAGVDLPAFGEDLPALVLTGRLTTGGDLGDARVQGGLTGSAPDLPDIGALAATLDLTWRDQVLSLTALDLREDGSGALLTATGVLDLGPSDGRFELNAAWEGLRWPLAGDALAESRQGRLDAEGSFADFRYALAGEVWGADFPAASLAVQGAGDRAGTRIGELRIDTLDGRITGSGALAWSPALTWDLELTGEGLDPGRQWPDIPGRIGVGITSSGGLDGYTYRVDGGIESQALPSAALRLAGEGDLAGTRIQSLRIDTLGGRIEGDGVVGWEPALTWEASLRAEDINPGTQWPEWPGRLGGQVASDGRIEDAGPVFRLAVEGVAGELRGFSVAADAEIAGQGGAIRFDELLLTSGPSRLEAKGELAEDRLRLAFEIDSPDLSTLVPDAKGRIEASGTASGTPSAPEVRVELAARGVEVAGQGLDELTGTAALDLIPGGRLDLDLEGQGIRAGGLALSRLRVQGDGELAAHRLSATAEGEPVAFELRASGGLGEDRVYAGQIGTLVLRTPDFGDWRLQGPADLRLAGPQIQLGPVCLRSADDAGGCLSFAQAEAGRWEAEVDLARVGLGLAAPFLPEGFALDGVVEAKGSFRGAAGALTGNASLRVPRGVLSGGPEGGVLADFSAARLTLDANGGGLKAAADVPLAGVGNLQADLDLLGWRIDAPARPEQPLRGRLRARADNLGPAPLFAPDLTNLSGRLDADLGLTGTLAAPGLTGQARLADLGFRVPLIGLAVSDGELEARARGGERIDYSGGLNIGGGRLALEGESARRGPAWETRLRASGDRLRVADSAQYMALVTPDVQLAVGAQGLALTGEVRIPEARIRPRTIPAGTVTPSPDVVLADEADRAAAMPVAIDLRLALGDQVSIDAFGLRGLLRGDLRVLQNPGRNQLLGDGTVAVVDGSYRLSTGFRLAAAIGQPLVVEQGRLVFARTPLDNPALLLTATREGGDMTAGVRVVGTLKSPQLTFFSDSDPSLTQAEITSFLVTGVPPRRGGIEQADRSLSVGTYVAPRLFTEFETGLGGSGDRVRMRYDLNSLIQLQTETGDAQGADVFFTFER